MSRSAPPADASARAAWALALAWGAFAAPAQAETTIANTRDAPIRTATVNNGAADDLRIDEDGQIDIEVDDVAGVTLDSANDLTLDDGALISADDVERIRGIVIAAEGQGDLDSAGDIYLFEDYTPEDTDDDGYIDEPFAQGGDRIGVLVEARATPLVGDIRLTEEAAISVEGNDSAGLRVLGAVNGDLVSAGSVSVVGDRGVAIDIQAPIAGDVSIEGSANATGEDSIAVDVAAPIQGRLYVRGALSATGYRYTTAPTDDDEYADLIEDGVLQGGPALRISSSVAGGVLLDGRGYEDDQDDNGNGITEDELEDDDDLEDDYEDAQTTISAYGNAPAVAIGNASAAMTLGAGAPLTEGEPGAGLDALNIGYGLVNRGTIAAYGIYDGVAATGVSLFGAGAATRTTIAGGVRNDGSIAAYAVEVDSTGLRIGAFVDAPTLYNLGAIGAASTAEADVAAYALRIEDGAGMSRIVNQGTIQAALYGETGDAIAIAADGTAPGLIENYGAIIAEISATDDDEDDDVDPVVTGRAIAIDVSRATNAVTIRQFASIARTDQDDEDDSSEPDVEIIGDILFGSGDDLLDLRAGLFEGHVDFGAGADALRIAGGATARGTFADADASLALDVDDGLLAIESGVFRVGSARIGARGVLSLAVSETASENSRLAVSNALRFEDGARIDVSLDLLLDDDAFFATGAYSQEIITAGSISGFAAASGNLTSAYLYTPTLAQNGANSLVVELRAKTPEELGLSGNESIAFDAAYRAVAGDADLSAAFAGISDGDQFREAYRQLLPSALAASTELSVAENLQVMQGAIARVGGPDAIAADAVTLWAQQAGGVHERAVDGFGAAWDGWNWNVSFGIDGPVQFGQLGFFGAFQISETDDGRATSGALATWRASAGAFWANDLPGGAIVRTSALAGVGRSGLDRALDIDLEDDDRDLAREISGEWTSASALAQIDLARPLRAGDFTLTPRIGAIGAVSWDGEYRESGGGGADLQVDARDAQRAYAFGELGARYAFRFSETETFSPYVQAGWRQRVAGEEAQLTARFTGGAPFTFVDATESEGRALIEAGFMLRLQSAQATLRYQREESDDYSRDAVEGRIRLIF
ncbi:MAG: autotransporter outer membrane beta-barrel domain-containing protein [Hyphomonadaceae bacterium]|nr:autotransporter outer membrane beta-barrel domain-containing protein [Hyphomonadaceae bacterium]